MTVNEDRKRNKGGRERRANAGHKEMETTRISRVLWKKVAPEDRPGGQDQFDRYTRSGDLTKNIDAIVYGLMIHPDKQRVLTHPWITRVPESLETLEGSQAHIKEVAVQKSLEIPGGGEHC